MLRTITLRCRSLRPKILVPPGAVIPARSSLRQPTVRTALPCLRSSLSYYSISTTPTTTSTTATHCPGCGAAFQQTQPDQPGYLVAPSSPTPAKKRKPAAGLDHASYASLVEALDPTTRALLEGTSVPSSTSLDDNTPTPAASAASDSTIAIATTPICQRCHQLTYHTRTNEPGNAAFLRSSQQYSSLVSYLRTKRQPLLLYVMDVTDMPWSIDALHQLAGGDARIIVVANKVDLLPTQAIKYHDQRIRDAITMNIKRTLGTTTTNAITSVQLVSAKKGWGINTLIKRLQTHLLPTDDVYIVGNVNAGKSALIQQLLNHHSRSLQKQQFKPTSSSVPGTTLGLVRIPLHILGLQQQQEQRYRGIAREHYLIDTPGLISPTTSLLPLKKPSTIHPVTFRLHAQQSLLLGHYVRIDVLDTTQQPLLMTLMTPSVAPHITKTAKLMQDATTNFVMVQPELTVTSTTNRQATMDLAFAGGIGWVALTGDFGRASLRIWLDPRLPSSAFAHRAPPFLPYEFRGQVRKFFGSGERAMQ